MEILWLKALVLSFLWFSGYFCVAAYYKLDAKPHAVIAVAPMGIALVFPLLYWVFIVW